MAPTGDIAMLANKMSSNDFGQPPAHSIDIEYMDVNRGPILVGISIGLAVTTTLILGGRFYAKRFGGAPLGLDDVFLTAAYIVNLGMCALGIIMTKVGGVGRHIEAVEAKYPEQTVGWAKTILAFEIIYFTSAALPKMAIVFLYLRIFNWRGLMRNLAILLLVIIASTGVSLIITACLQCQPIAYWWDSSIEGGHCLNVQRFFHVQCIPGIILDLFIMALPVHTVWNLKLPVYKRIALLVIFLVATPIYPKFSGIVAAILRAVAFFDTSAFNDRTYASVTLIGWSIVETSTYIITASLPSLRPLIAHYTPRWLKDMVRKTISHASDSLTKHYHTRRDDDDEVQLTARSRKHNRQSQHPRTLNAKTSNAGMSASMEDAESTELDEWPSPVHKRAGSTGTMAMAGRGAAFPRSEEFWSNHGTKTVVRNSGIHVKEDIWEQDGIKVQTEVKIERSRSIPSLKRHGRSGSESPSRV
ncbi:integral membrane protein [Zalerion maritima]|uniref:Integral membrane protein n=1 Tax=Zalerion maritima TaxID=339359 RepID=A0AAD5WUY5_9PEZI|nr:integral membrane protein [Zalerion maritima]